MKPPEFILPLKKPFESIRSIFNAYEKDLTVIVDQPDSYYLSYPEDDERYPGKFFSAIQIRKDKIFVYFGALNNYPELLRELPEGMYQYMNPGGILAFQRTNLLILDELAIVADLCFKKEKFQTAELVF